MRSDIGGRAALGRNPELQLFFGTIANSFITSQASKAATDLCQPANVMACIESLDCACWSGLLIHSVERSLDSRHCISGATELRTQFFLTQ